VVRIRVNRLNRPGSRDCSMLLGDGREGRRELKSEAVGVELAPKCGTCSY
jgi:hypothetical protein